MYTLCEYLLHINFWLGDSVDNVHIGCKSVSDVLLMSFSNLILISNRDLMQYM